MAYVYLFLDPTNDYLPFYVGKGTGKRWKHHLSGAGGKNKDRQDVIDAIRAAGEQPAVMFWDDGLTDEEAFHLERDLILRFGRKLYDEGGILTNMCIDNLPVFGDGSRLLPIRNVPHREETKEKMRLAAKGRKKSEEHCRNISLSKQWRYELTTPSGEVLSLITAELKQFCLDNGMSYDSIKKSISLGKKYKGYTFISKGRV